MKIMARRVGAWACCHGGTQRENVIIATLPTNLSTTKPCITGNCRCIVCHAFSNNIFILPFLATTTTPPTGENEHNHGESDVISYLGNPTYYLGT